MWADVGLRSVIGTTLDTKVMPQGPLFKDALAHATIEGLLGIQVRAFQHVHGEARGPLGPETRCVTSTHPAPRQDKSQESIDMWPSRARAPSQTGCSTVSRLG